MSLHNLAAYLVMAGCLVGIALIFPLILLDMDSWLSEEWQRFKAWHLDKVRRERGW